MPPTLLFNTDFQNGYVIDASYTFRFNDNTSVRGSNFDDVTSDGKIGIKLLLDDTSIFRNKRTFTIKGKFTLDTDKEIVIDGSGRITKGGFFSRFRIQGNGSYVVKNVILDDQDEEEEGDNDDNTTNPNGIIDYIPSGNGIKRLGIADYRKVEQTVCCYVPGEVSHIENIMAREFKEKETRRLRRREDTTTSSSEFEAEKLTDTTSTDRYEMNQETASVLSQDKEIGAHAEFSASWGGGGSQYGMSAGADFAMSTSKEESSSQSVTYAKDVTERALDRVVQKTKEERIVKIIEEYQEKNVHGFDNRNGSEHISGVYRWVDKIYKNQVINYGKRLMYEFMIPEPAAFHNLAIAGQSQGEVMSKPIDPRTHKGGLNLKDYTKITDATYAHWAGVYNAEVKAKPQSRLSVSKGFHGNHNSTGYFTTGSDTIIIPDGYEVDRANASVSFDFHPHGMEGSGISVNIGSKNFNRQWEIHFNEDNIYFDGLGGVQKELAVAYKAFDCGTFSMTVVAKCTLTTEAEQQWKINTFNAIIKAYEAKIAAYESKTAEIKNYTVNPGFYRQIENMVLRKNCISYLANHSNMGHSLLVEEKNLQEIRIDYTSDKLESYAARVKFFEQAFEWNIMSYNFYPFYWANKDKWKDMYNVTEFNDPLHRSFLQSGMARVIVTVRPGFEEVVNWYMATGQIWNGGDVPIMDDELFLSIVDELREPEGAVEETWETRVPTTLTVIQAGSIGLDVEGLPCNKDCDDFKLFDSDGDEILDADGNSLTNPIKPSNAQIGEENDVNEESEPG